MESSQRKAPTGCSVGASLRDRLAADAPFGAVGGAAAGVTTLGHDRLLSVPLFAGGLCGLAAARDLAASVGAGSAFVDGEYDVDETG